MAEYYPLLVKAVGRLPNSTPESRRVIYERARKALIGQLRTQHPPVPDEDIERESIALDRAVGRLETEIAAGGAPGAAAAAEIPAGDAAAQPAGGARPLPPTTPPVSQPTSGGALGPAEQRPIPPLRTKTPRPPLFPKKADASRQAPVVPVPASPPPPSPQPQPQPQPQETAGSPPALPPSQPPATAEEGSPPPPAGPLKPPRSDRSRPIAPQPSASREPSRRLWIIPVGIGVVVALVAAAAWKLRDRPEMIARTKPAEQSQTDSGKIAERVGGTGTNADEDKNQTPPAAPTKQNGPTSDQATNAQPQRAVPVPSNPELPVAHRAALLVEAPDEPNKVKTFLGTVIWKLNNVPQGANDAVGLAVQADIDLPDDKLKAVITFEKNADTSLAASHTIKVRFTVDPGSFSGNVKQISTPQMRPEASPSGEALAGVTVPIVPNAFLVGLSPGNAEAANIDLMRRLQWIDIPMLLDNGKIAKLTFEKSDSGQRDLNEAFANWQK